MCTLAHSCDQECARVQHSLRRNRPSQTDLPPRSEKHGSKFVSSPACVPTNSNFNQTPKRSSDRHPCVSQRCAPNRAPKTPKNSAFSAASALETELVSPYLAHHEKVLISLNTVHFVFVFLWCPILCALGCVTQQWFPASHSFQLHEEVFCVSLCMRKW